jgi:hypothetical protein
MIWQDGVTPETQDREFRVQDRFISKIVRKDAL